MSKQKQQVLTPKQISALAAAHAMGVTLEVPRAVEAALDKITPSEEEVKKRETFHQLIERYGLNPAEELFKMVDNTIDEELRVKILLDLLPYQFPKLKAVMTEQVVDMNISVNVKKFNRSAPVDREKRIRSAIDIDSVPEEVARHE